MELIESIEQQADLITALRRDLHAHPELAFEENRTADKLAAQLQAWGLQVHRGLGKTGLVAMVPGRDQGACGRAIGLRADLDALPIQELNGFEHASRHQGKMHACGHDGHMAMLMAAGQYLAQHRNFDGTVYLIFSPAEEGGAGAHEMIKDGLFELFPMEAVFGMHNWPALPAGKMAVSAGPVMGSTSEFIITVRGKGGHAAMPDNTTDPVPIACQIVQGFQTIISRNAKPIDAGVISVTMIHAGQASNVIADHCEIQGTVRTFTLEMLDMIEQRMQEISAGISRAFGAACDFEFTRSYPPTINSPYEAAFCRRVMTGLIGKENALEQEPTLGGEDFAFMLQALPGAYCFIGNGSGKHRGSNHAAGPCTLHNPHYDFNDALIPLGGSYWVRLAEQWLAHEPPSRA